MAFNMRHDMVKQYKEQASNPSGGSSHAKKVPNKDKPLHEQITDTLIPDEDAHVVAQVVDEYGEQAFEYEREESPYIDAHPDDVLAYWEGPEYEVHKKSATWYTVATLLLCAFALYSVLTDSHIAAITALVIGAVGFLYTHATPRVLEYAITTEGIVVGDRIYHYDEIDSYWIYYEPPHTRIISLHVEGHLFPYVHVPLHQLDPVEVRETLSEYMHEKRQQQTLLDTFERLLHI